MSDSLLEKVAVLAIDKLLFGAAIALVAFWLQRRLETAKRSETLLTEHAKAVLAAFSRAMNAVYEVHACVIAASASGWSAAGRENAVKAVDELGRSLKQNRHYLGSAFFSVGLHAAAAGRRATEGDSLEAIQEQDFEIAKLRRVMLEAIPPFARMPKGEARFRYPSSEEAYAASGYEDDWNTPTTVESGSEPSPRAGPPQSKAS